MRRLTEIPKPYTCELSKKYSGIEIQYEGDAILLCPFSSDALHNRIKDALNGAFLEGVLYAEMNKVSKKKYRVEYLTSDGWRDTVIEGKDETDASLRFMLDFKPCNRKPKMVSPKIKITPL